MKNSLKKAIFICLSASAVTACAGESNNQNEQASSTESAINFLNEESNSSNTKLDGKSTIDLKTLQAILLEANIDSETITPVQKKAPNKITNILSPTPVQTDKVEVEEEKTVEPDEKVAVVEEPEEPAQEPDNKGVSPQSVLVDLLATEQSGVSRKNEWVRTGVPFKKGTLKSTNNLALWDAGLGKAYPVDTKVLAVWPDNSIRWLLVNADIGFSANQGRKLSLGIFSDPVKSSKKISVSQTDNAITLNNGALKVEVDKKSGQVINKVWRNNKLVWQSDGKSGPWIKKSGKTYWGENLTSNSTPKSSDNILKYRSAVSNNGQQDGYLLHDPWDLTVKIEEQSDSHAIILVSGAHLDANGDSFSFFKSRLHFGVNTQEIKVDHTLVYNGEASDKIQGYGFKLPIIGDKADIESQSLAQGTLLQQDHDSYSIAGASKTGESLGLVTRQQENNKAYVILKDMSENYPKALKVGQNSIDVQLYPENLPALDLKRYSNTLDRANGEVGDARNRGAQGLAKTETFVVGFSTDTDSDIQKRARALDAAPIMLLASPTYYSDARVLGVGDFDFSSESNSSSSHFRIDRKLKVMEDFMRYNQRKQYNWYGMINYGDIRGRFKGGNGFTWSEKGRYGWSGNSGEPNNQLWIQYFRTTNPDVLVDAIAMSKHTMDVQMVHYGDSDVTSSADYNGRNRSFTTGSLHRHGRQAWSGYAGLPDYSHVAGVETYYYLTGDYRAKETLFEASQFIERYFESSPEATALVNGIDVLDRGLAVFYDDPKATSRYNNRLDVLLDYLTTDDSSGDNPVEKSLENKNHLSAFSELVRGFPGLLYRHERLGEQKVADLILDAADIWVGNGDDPWSLTDSGAATGTFYIMNPLAYAHGLQKKSGQVDSELTELLTKIFAWHTHALPDPDAGQISLASWNNIPENWADWSWEFETDEISTNNPGILWIDRQLTFRNDFMQDYHSYRAFSHLASLAAQVNPI